jgi:hypothetical protein
MSADGVIRVGMENLQAIARTSERTIRRAREQLRAGGVLEWESGAGRGHPTTYFAKIPGVGVATRQGFQLEIPGGSCTETPAVRAPTPVDSGLDSLNRVPHDETPADPVRVSAVLRDLRHELATTKNGGRS